MNADIRLEETDKAYVHLFFGKSLGALLAAFCVSLLCGCGDSSKSAPELSRSALKSAATLPETYGVYVLAGSGWQRLQKNYHDFAAVPVAATAPPSDPSL